MKIGNKNFDENRTHIMGILNVTDNSFSDGGRYNTLERAIRHAEEMVSDGAAIIDVGGESTHPGYTQISDEEEIYRVCPVIEKIKAELDIPVSVDTYKSRVCEAAAKAGADMINDIWGFKYDGSMAQTAAKYNMSACLMHNRKNTDYSDFMTELVSDLRESIALAENAGIENIITDPGIGFAKSYEQNLLAMRELDRLKELDRPILLGVSKKSVIGITLGGDTDSRLEGTLATSVYAAMHGCMFVRVHDVAENLKAVKMTESILYGN